eukprot:1160007-Pelagomonas_calceolata.AAC.8
MQLTWPARYVGAACSHATSLQDLASSPLSCGFLWWQRPGYQPQQIGGPPKKRLPLSFPAAALCSRPYEATEAAHQSLPLPAAGGAHPAWACRRRCATAGWPQG